MRRDQILHSSLEMDIRKHTLDLKLNIAQVLSAQDALELRKSALQDIKAQRNWLDRCFRLSLRERYPLIDMILNSERLSLLKQLQMVVADRQQVSIGLELRKSTPLILRIDRGSALPLGYHPRKADAG